MTRAMKIHLIRNATIRLDYGGRLILLDPYLAPKESLESFAGISKNPIVDLPITPEEVIAEVEMVLISHLHTDHFDSLETTLLAL